MPLTAQRRQPPSLCLSLQKVPKGEELVWDYGKRFKKYGKEFI